MSTWNRRYVKLVIEMAALIDNAHSTFAELFQDDILVFKRITALKPLVHGGDLS